VFSPKTLQTTFDYSRIFDYKIVHSGGRGFMPNLDRIQEIRKLHDKMYEQSLVFLALRNHPDYRARLAETREQIIRIYSRIQTLA
jgi:hypothetical protein